MNTLYAFMLTVALSVVGTHVKAQHKPYPQALSYPGCIKPTNTTQAEMNASVARYYTYWKGQYLRNDLASLPGGYYIRAEISGDDEGYTPLGTSEGHGYGMVITVLMAGYDPDAHAVYDGLFKTARAYHSSINENLMGWVIADSASAQGHFDSATEGDMDIAYSLILAHYQWGSDGSVNYLAEARKMITSGLKVANLTSTSRLNLGDWDSKSTLNTRPSDWMLSHIRAFAQETGDVAWTNLIHNLYDIYTQFNINYSPATGLISDFVVKNPPAPAPENFTDEGPQTNEYNYNACRVPLRIVMDYALYGNRDAYIISNRIAAWIISKSGGQPACIKDGYKLNGAVSGSEPEAVFIAPFLAASVVNPANQAFLNSGWNFLKNKKSGYYSDTYNLLCQLFISGNWWKPEVSTPVCIPVSASTDDGNVPANVMDGDFETRWSADGDGQFLQFCLDTLTVVNGVDIAFYHGDSRQAIFDVQTSVDGVTWIPIVTGFHSSGKTNGLESFRFVPTVAKYVKLVGHGNSMITWNSYTEVRVRTVRHVESISLVAIQDAYVRNGAKADSALGMIDPTVLLTKRNNATDVGYDRQAYLGFDVQVEGTIVNATLEVYGKLDGEITSGVPVGVYAVPSSWREDRLTWNNKPATDSVALSSVTITDSTPRYYSWDVTDYIKRLGNTRISLALINNTISTPRVLFHSKESGSHLPRLIIRSYSNIAYAIDAGNDCINK
jgi:endo-1,4-beta-D-glucanase Y